MLSFGWDPGHVGKAHFLARFHREFGPEVEEDLASQSDMLLDVPKPSPGGPGTTVTIDGESFPVIGPLRRVKGDIILTGILDFEPIIVAGRSGDSIKFAFDIWHSLGTRLLGRSVSPASTDWGRPIVDEIEARIIAALEETLGKRRAKWPSGARLALGLSHDVDRVAKVFQHVTHPVRHLRSGSVKRAVMAAIPRGNPYWRFEDIKALEARLKVTSTFFFLHEVPDNRRVSITDRIGLLGSTRLDRPEVARAMQQLSASGWEIGLHSSSYSRNNPNRLKQERRLIEQITGRECDGVRQHFLATDIPALWPDQAHVGFKYDSSMGFAERLGFRSGTSFPYPVDPAGKLLEVPFQIMDGALFGAADPWSACQEIIDRTEAVGGALVILWHQRVFDEVDFPGLAHLYERIISQCRSRGAWIAPLERIAEWWRRD